MHRFRPPWLALPLVLALAIARVPAASAAWTHDPTANLQMCSTVNSHQNPTISSDGSGGAFVAWEDYRNSGATGADIYMQHITRAGVLDPTWPVNGLAVVALAGDQAAPVSISDGAGGVIIAWHDHRGASWDIYAQRILSNATVAPGWAANGSALIAFPGNDETGPHIVTDGAGGAYITCTRHYSVNDYDPILIHVLAGGAVPLGFLGGIDLDAALSDESAAVPAYDDSGGVVVAYHTNKSGNYDIWASRINPNAVVQWNMQLCNDATIQNYPVIAPDGHRGAFVAWTDTRAGNPDVYASHVRSNGVIFGSWTGGIAVGYSGFNDTALGAVPDLTGGVYVVWSSGLFFTECLVHHLDSGGLSVSGWPSGGTNAGDNTGNSAAMADGSGGVIIASSGLSSFITGAIFASRLTPGGSFATGWSSPNVGISTVGAGVGGAVVTTDGNGGAIAAWFDFRSGVQYDVFAQRIERFGQLGSPEPVITGIKDVKNDQGGQVRVSWNGSYLDADPTFGVNFYRIWRQAPASSAQLALARGEAVLESDLPSARIPAASQAGSARAPAPANASIMIPSGKRVIRTSIESGQVIYWELAGSQTAAGFPAYSFVASTTGDSIGASNPYTPFMVDAGTYGYATWSSQPDSGYSVDNLPPVAPAPFTASYAPPSGTFLAWGANGEPDLAGYRLYRGFGLGFVPSPANRIYQGVVPSYQDVTSTVYVYKVCGYDIHGNEGRCSTADAPGTTAAESTLPRELTLAPVTPNPTHGTVTFRLGLPRDARVALSIFDAQGRKVRTVLEGVQVAGWIEARWDGRDESGSRAASGLYFVQLDAGMHRLTRRLVRIE